MNLAGDLNAQVRALAEQPSTASALSALRAAARVRLAEKMLPEKFSETWKYTKLQALLDGHLTRYSAPASAPADLPHFGNAPLVVINGRLPATLPQRHGLTLTTLTASSTPPLADTTFALLNGATLIEGLHVKVAKGAHPEPLHIIFYNTAPEPCHHNTRLLVELEENSRLQLVEHYISQGSVLTNAVTEIIAHANSELLHCRLQADTADSLHIGQLAIRQERHSRVASHQFMTAARLQRNDVHVMLEGEGADLVMGGAFITRGKRHVDNQICVEHRVPHCTSSQDYKGIAGDEGRAIFNGRIHILPGASQTNASLSNKNLLLSLGAEIDTKPELEIYNDDVKCAHGTTVGQIDPLMRFYLQSRGIDAVTAQRMLSLGFIQQQIANLPDALADWVGAWLGQAVTEATP